MSDFWKNQYDQLKADLADRNARIATLEAQEVRDACDWSDVNARNTKLNSDLINRDRQLAALRWAMCGKQWTLEGSGVNGIDRVWAYTQTGARTVRGSSWPEFLTALVERHEKEGKK